MPLNLTITFTASTHDLACSTTGDDSTIDYWMHMCYTRGWVDVLDGGGKHVLVPFNAIERVIIT